jgi:hypothetical protein
VARWHPKGQNPGYRQGRDHEKVSRCQPMLRRELPNDGALKRTVHPQPRAGEYHEDAR